MRRSAGTRSGVCAGYPLVTPGEEGWGWSEGGISQQGPFSGVLLEEDIAEMQLGMVGRTRSDARVPAETLRCGCCQVQVSIAMSRNRGTSVHKGAHAPRSTTYLVLT